MTASSVALIGTTPADLDGAPDDDDDDDDDPAAAKLKGGLGRLEALGKDLSSPKEGSTFLRSYKFFV